MPEGLIGFLCITMFSLLRVSVNGSFPKPLPEAEEQLLLRQWMEGDCEARNRSDHFEPLVFNLDHLTYGLFLLKE